MEIGRGFNDLFPYKRETKLLQDLKYRLGVEEGWIPRKALEEYFGGKKNVEQTSGTIGDAGQEGYKEPIGCQELGNGEKTQG